MNWLSIQKDKIKQVVKDIRQISTGSKLLDYLSIDKLSSIAYFFVMIWIFIPLFLMLLSLTFDRSSAFSFMFNSSKLTIIWYMLMQQIGYLGFILLIIVIMKSIRQKMCERINLKTYILNHLFEILMIFFILISFISTLFSSDFELSLFGSNYRKDGFLSYIAYTGFFTCGYLAIKKKQTIIWMHGLVLVSVILGLLLIINEPKINELLTFHYLSTVFYNPNHMGYFLVIAIFSSIYLLVKEYRMNRYTILYYLAYVILLVSLIENGSFGPYIAVTNGVIFLILFTWMMKRQMLFHVLTIAIIFLVISFSMNFKTGFLSKEIMNLSQGANDIIEQNEDAPQAGSGRWSLWTNGLEFIIEKPLLGHGIENLEQAYLEEGINQDRPHNELIQIGASIGLPALIFYILAFGVFFLDFLKNNKRNTIQIIAFTTIVFAYLVSSLFGNSMFYTTPFFMIILGVTRHLIIQEKHVM